jgi:alpha-glucoside transport system permease protein
VTGQTLTAEPQIVEVPPGARAERWRRYGVAALFLTPTAILLTVWVIYPAVYTIVRSFFGNTGYLGKFVGFDNYRDVFTTDLLVTAIKNNALWVAIVPALVTAIGLVFAVLTERVSWSVAFKTAVFMPMAISLLAAGVIWRLMYQQDPSQGTINAAIRGAKEIFVSPGPLSSALPSTPQLTGSPSSGLVLQRPLRPGQVAHLGLTAIPPQEVPPGGVQAVDPKPIRQGITGVVWRDFRPGGGTPGKVERLETGLPGVTVVLRDAAGKQVGTAATRPNGTFSFEQLEPGSYRVGIGAATFRKAFGGVSWLGSRLITPAIMIAYIWVWAGFAMVVIAAGLAAIPRDVLEAARTDGAGEWQVFRRVTVPLLAPILSVVFITMLINVLKVFDIVVSVAPQSEWGNAGVIALQMWQTSFGGANDFGLGSAIAVFLFILVVPVLALNVRRFKREV